jgi:hypothetical protein
MIVLALFVAIAIACITYLVCSKKEGYSYVPKMTVVEDPEKAPVGEVMAPLDTHGPEDRIRRVIRTLQVNTNTYLI